MLSFLPASSWPSILGILLMLGASAVVLRHAQARYALAPERVRKQLHVVMGMAVLSFPWLFDQAAPVAFLALITTGLLVAVRCVERLRTGLGGVLHGIERTSYGELCFPLAVFAVFALAGGEPLLFGLPMLLLAFADPAAAFVGLRYGRRRYYTADGIKTVEGSLAFFVVAFCCSGASLLFASGAGWPTSLLVALLVSLIATMVEAASWRGLDNLFVPLSTFWVLQANLPLDAPTLAARLFALLTFLAATLVWHLLAGRPAKEQVFPLSRAPI